MIIKKRAFTLIELLIVITIIAILAGAAIPYVKDYVDDARYARAKEDLTEIRNALVRFETDRNASYLSTSVGELVGPYLQKVLVDPWGGSYLVSDAASKVYSAGPDGVANNGDDVAENFRPPLALSKAYWEDADLSGTVNDNDNLIFKFTRPVPTGPALAETDFGFSAPADVPVFGATTWVSNREVKVVMATVGVNPLVAGLTTIVVSLAGQATIQDGAIPPVNCKPGQPIPIRAR